MKPIKSLKSQSRVAAPVATSTPTHSRSREVAAFAVIYIVWGSTYLAIKYAIETIPPLLMAGSRFIAAGILLWFLTRKKGTDNPKPSRKDWYWAFVIGALMLLAGNGFLSIAEQEMPTGVGALLIASVPLWIVIFEFLQGASKPRLLVLVGLAAGFLGVALLANNKAGWSTGEVNLW